VRPLFTQFALIYERTLLGLFIHIFCAVPFLFPRGTSNRRLPNVTLRFTFSGICWRSVHI